MPQHFHSQHLHSVLYNEICSKFISVFPGWNVSTWPLRLAVSLPNACKHTTMKQIADRCRNRHKDIDTHCHSLLFPLCLFLTLQTLVFIAWLKAYSQGLMKELNLWIHRHAESGQTTRIQAHLNNRPSSELLLLRLHFLHSVIRSIMKTFQSRKMPMSNKK